MIFYLTVGTQDMEVLKKRSFQFHKSCVASTPEGLHAKQHMQTLIVY